MYKPVNMDTDEEETLLEAGVQSTTPITPNRKSFAIGAIVLSVLAICTLLGVAIYSGGTDVFAGPKTPTINIIVDDYNHSYAGVAHHRKNGTACNYTYVYSASCTVNLVDISGLPYRRTLITSGRCLDAFMTSKYYPGIGDHVVTFDRVPNKTRDETCAIGKNIIADPTPPYWFHITYAWNFCAGVNGDACLQHSDWAVLLLDEEVPSSIVPNLAQIGLVTPTIKQIGSAGYGTATSGIVNPPQGILTRRYGNFSVISITPYEIVADINAAQGKNDTSAVHYGSLAITPTNNPPFIGWGVLLFTSRFFKATAHYCRIGTQDWLDWISLITPEVTCIVNTGLPCT